MPRPLEDALNRLAPSRGAELITRASDLVLVIGPDDVVADYDDSAGDPNGYFAEPPTQQKWADLVTVESGPKVTELLEAARNGDGERWRQINFVGDASNDIPFSFRAVRVDDAGTVVAMGRDMRPMAEVQQRLVEAQITLERESARVRQAETRYQILFRNSREAVLTIDPETETVLEANEAAAAVLGRTRNLIVNTGLSEAFRDSDPRLVQSLVAKARLGSDREVEEVLRGQDGRNFRVNARYVRLAPASFVMLRIVVSAGGAPEPDSSRSAMLDRLFDAVPDGIVVTDDRGRVIRANVSFQSLAQLSSEEQACGHSLDQWLGRPGTDLGVFLSNVRKHGRLQNYATTVTGEIGMETNVEISSASMTGSDGTALAFVIRNVDQRLVPEAAGGTAPGSGDGLVELIGKLTLKQIVQQTTDEIERLCIQSALMLTGGNRASAAKLLGLSRQGFYVKLRRYDFGDK